MIVDRAHRRRRQRRHHRAHHAGAGHAHEPGAAVLVVGAGCVDRAACWCCPVRARRASSTCIVDYRYARALFGGNTGISLVDSGSPSRTGDATSSRLPAVGVAAELVPVTFRKRAADARRRCSPASASSASPRSPPSPSRPTSPCRGTGSGINLEGFGDKIADLLPYALVHAAAAARRGRSCMGVGAARRQARTGIATAPRASPPRSCSPFFGLGMVFVGMVGGALMPFVDLGLQGTVFEEGAPSYVVYGAVLAGLGARRLLGPQVRPGRALPELPALGLAAARRPGRDPRLGAVLHRRVPRPAGGRRPCATTTARPSC